MSTQKVYMHNMIHEMALWIVSAVREGRRFLVKTDTGLTNLPYETDWITVTKMSLMNNEIASIADSSLFPNPDRLVTLFLQNNKLVDIVGRFFQVLSTLVVLDLSHNPGITELPGDIKWLVSQLVRDEDKQFARYTRFDRTDSLGFGVHIQSSNSQFDFRITKVAGVEILSFRSLRSYVIGELGAFGGFKTSDHHYRS